MTALSQCNPDALPDDTSNQVFAAGLDLIRRGRPVFVIEPNGKAPATEHGFKDATLDVDHFRRELLRVPNANLAIPTGPASGFDVLDVDHRPDGSGWAAWRLLQAEGFLPEPLGIVRTPSGGGHFFYAASGRNSGRLPRHWLDYKASGGYVVAPPSVINGRAYEWISPLRDAEERLDWDAIVDRLTPRRSAQTSSPRQTEGTSVEHLVGWVAALPEGRRNDGLFWAANRALERGCHDVLHRLADAAIQAGLTPREAERTIRSAERRGGAA